MQEKAICIKEPWILNNIIFFCHTTKKQAVAAEIQIVSAARAWERDSRDCTKVSGSISAPSSSCVLSIAEKVAKRERKESANKAPRNRVALRNRLRLRVSVSMHICFSFSSTALRSALTPLTALYIIFFLHNICNISLDEVHCSRSPRLEKLQVGARAKLLSRLSFCLFFLFSLRCLYFDSI